MDLKDIHLCLLHGMDLKDILEKFGKGEIALAEAHKQIEYVRNNLAR